MVNKLLIFLLLCGNAAFLYQAHQLAFGTLMQPRSGFWPTLSGSTAVLTALWLLFRAMKSRAASSSSPGAVNWTKFIFIFVGFFFYVSSFDFLGYFSATFIFLFYLFKISDMVGWLKPFLYAAGSATAFFLIFKHLLGVILP